MLPKRVLIFPCASEIALEIFRSLQFSTHVSCYGATSASTDIGETLYPHYISNVPHVSDPDFVTCINALCNEHQIHAIFPAHDSVCLKLAEAVNFGKLTTPVIGSVFKTTQLCRSKKATYDYFSALIETPAVYDACPQDGFPFFLKPDIGQGSKGAFLANTPEEVHHARLKDPSLLILENLPGEEYTVDCFTTYDGRLLVVKARHRMRTLNGISSCTLPVNSSEFLPIAETINAHLSFNGPWFFQVKRNQHGGLSLLEISPRIAGSSGLWREKGINLPLLSIFNVFRYPVEILENDISIMIERPLDFRCKTSLSFDHVYVDFDDTITVRNSINSAVIKLLFDCLNHNKKIHLITRHKTDIYASLKALRISELFDSVIHLKNGEKKSECITHSSSIFIDDSFQERKDVATHCKIPVFDTHMMCAIQGALNE